MHAGNEEVGNLNSSVRRDGKSLNVLLCWRVKCNKKPTSKLIRLSHVMQYVCNYFNHVIDIQHNKLYWF